MLKISLNIKQINKKFSTLIFFLIILTMITFSIINNDIKVNSNNLKKKNENYLDNFENVKSSSIWGIVNLTNLDINNTCHYHNETIPIKGELFDGLIGISGYLMVIYVDGILFSSFNDTTDFNGEFEINFTIPYSLNIYYSHTIEANVWNPPDTVRILNRFVIYTNATSYFDIENYNQNSPQLAGSTYNIPGYLRYDNGSGIPSQQIDSFWNNETDQITPSNPTIFTNIDGSFQSVPIPDDNVSNILYLNLTYAGWATFINGTQTLVSVRVFRNITCEWNTVASTTEGNSISINGYIYSRKFRNLVINFTEIRLRRNGASIGTTTTDATGNFSFTYTFPSGTAGPNIIAVELLNAPTVISNITHSMNVAAVPPPPVEDIGDDDDDTPAPYQNFFMVLIPIIIGGVAGFLIYAYFFLKKQEEESLHVKLPLEGRILNLKILKETGRMEEALSYLFQSIYLELINAKYGRIKQATETIRDFAIISVKELNLNPASIYPFIQNVEKIIYDKPFIISEEDFYTAIDLFSPVYFELTGYNFILNF